MTPGYWRYVKAAFNVRPLGMLLAPNWIALAGFAALGVLSWAYWIVGIGLELAYLNVLAQSPRFRRMVDGMEERAEPGSGRDEDVAPPPEAPPGEAPRTTLDLPPPEAPPGEAPRAAPDLPPTRVPLVEALTSRSPLGARQLRALAELLGMKDASSAPVAALPHGLSLLAARLPYPTPLRGHPVALVAIDAAEAREAEPARVRATLQAALQQAGQRFELPFVLLASGDIAQDLLPSDLGSLRLGERELHALLYARDPERTFAGLLHARGLLGLSPYSAAGEVKDDQMFFGRVALLKELILAPSMRTIVVGPRRVGKSSLLKRLLRELPARRPEVEPIFLDLLGIDNHTRAVRALSRELRVEVPSGMEPAAAFAELLRARFQDTGPTSAAGGPRSLPAAGGPASTREGRRRGLVVLDEADGLVEADAATGFRLLSAMRVLQAEDICSFIFAGYVYLYREALNQRSPLYNFATVCILGPLEPDAARDLALLPMQRLGVTYADPALPARIAERAGGYPSFIQTLCDTALQVLREVGSNDLILSAEHIARAEALVTAELRDVFHANTSKTSRLIAYLLVNRDVISAGGAASALAMAVGRLLPNDAVEAALQELRLLGFAAEAQGRISWTIPLLRDALRASQPLVAAAQLAEELREKP